MASDIDAWWNLNFQKHSIKDMNSLSVFRRFCELQYPYQLIDESKDEVFTSNEIEESLTWRDGSRVEKFSHNKGEDLYSYEVTYPEKNSTVTVKSWVQKEAEWGSIDKTFEGWQLHEAWKLNPPNRFYERFSIEQGLKRGFRCGVTPKGDLYERWVEEIWEEADEDVFKKTWEKVGQSGGETKTRKQDYLWGEEWYSDSTRSHQKCWHELLTHKWGSESGREGRDKSWEHNWDINTGHKLDEKISLQAGAVKGYRYTQNGEDWHKLEWQGTESLPVGQDSAEAIIAKYLTRIDEIYVKEHSGSLNSDHTLRLLLKGAPGYKVQVTALGDRLERIHAADRASPADLLDRIDELRDLQDAQERLKQTMWEASTVDWRLFEVYIDSLREQVKDSLNTLEQFSGLVENDHLDPEIKKAKAEIEQICAAESLNFGSQIDSWKSILSSLESTKRSHLTEVRKPDEDLTHTLHQQDLEDAVKGLYGSLTKTHDFVGELNSLAGGSSSIKSNIDVLRNAYESGYSNFQTRRNPAQLLSLLGTLEGYIPIEIGLLTGLETAQAAGLQDTVQTAIELVLSTTDLAKKLLTNSPEEVKAIEEFLIEAEKAVAEIKAFPSLIALVKLLKIMGKGQALVQRGVEKGIEDNQSQAEALELFEEISKETHSLAEDISTEDLTAQEQLPALREGTLLPIREYRTLSRKGQLPQGLKALKRYLPFLRRFAKTRSAQGIPHSVVQTILDLLEPSVRDLTELATDLSDDSPLYQPQIQALARDATVPFTDYRRTPHSDYIPKAIQAIRAYHPLLKQLSKRLRDLPKSSESQAADPVVSELMESLLPILKDVQQLATEMSEVDPVHESQLKTLEETAALPFTEYRKSPRREHLTRALGAIRGYHPLLRELAKKLGLGSAMSQLEFVLTDVHRVAADLVGADPDHTPHLQKLLQDAGIPFKEFRISPKKEHLPQAFKALRAYFPFLRNLGDRRTMNLLESVLKELHPIVSRFLPDLQLHLSFLRERAAIPFREYRTSPKPAHLPEVIHSLQSYHKLLRTVPVLSSQQYQAAESAEKQRSDSLPENEAMELLEEISKETHSLAEDISTEDITAQEQLPALREGTLLPIREYRTLPRKGQLHQGLKALKRYLPFLRRFAKTRSAQGIPHSVVHAIMDLLEPSVRDLSELATDLSDDSPLYQSQIQALARDATVPFTDYRRTPNSDYIPKAIQGIRAYHPFLKQLSKRLRDRPKLSESQESESIISELMEALEPVLKDTQQLATEMSEGNPDHNSQLKALKETAALPFTEYRTSPRREHLTRVLGAIRGYHPLLRELAKKLGLELAMNLLEPVLADVNSVAEELVDSDPDHTPQLQRLQQDAGIPFREYSISPKKEHLPQAFKALGAYFPFLRIIGDRHAMKLLEPTLRELHSIMVRSGPGLHSELNLIQERAAVPFREYRISPKPKHLPEVVASLRKYHELIPALPVFSSDTESPVITESSQEMFSEPIPVIREPELASSPARLQQATSVIEEEKQQAVSSNVILQTMQKANVPYEKPLTYLNIFKFFEEFMDKKFEVDTGDLATLRRPRTITEFVMEHLIRQFGIKSLALKFLGQLLPGLKILLKENNPYAILFARLLQLFRPDPIQFPLAVFLTRIRPEFHKLIEKCTREREIREKRSGKKPAKGTTFGRAQSDLAATGGEAFTADVILLVYDLFANDHHSGVLALQLLKPEGASLVDYLLFCVCHKMAKQGNTPEGIFNLIDKDGGGSIDQGEFVRGIKTSLDLWISEEDIIAVHVALAVDGQLSKAAFLSRCNFDWYQSVVKSEEYITTKCKFLNMLIDVFNREQTQNAALLLDLFQIKGEDPMTRETFTNVVNTLDSERNTDTRVEKMWNYGLGLTAEATALSQNAFIKVMLQYPSGEFARSKFCKDYSDIPELEAAVEDRKMETVDITVKEAPSKKGGMMATLKTPSTLTAPSKSPRRSRK